MSDFTKKNKVFSYETLKIYLIFIIPILLYGIYYFGFIRTGLATNFLTFVFFLACVGLYLSSVNTINMIENEKSKVIKEENEKEGLL
jgi:hypothetical protein